MKRLFVLLAVLASVSWCVAGCGGAGNKSTTVKKAEAEKLSELGKAEKQMELMKAKMQAGKKK
jgi:hypothetical protein